jgi:quinol monooxygenase YgiN
VQTGQGDWPAGLVSHAAGEADDGTFIVSEVWSSRADQDAFMTSRLGAALVTAYPRVRWVPLVAFHQPGA